MGNLVAGRSARLALELGISDRALRVLLRMALSTRDTSDGPTRLAGCYFGGPELLASALNIVPALRDDYGDFRLTKSQARRVELALTELREVGLISYRVWPHRGKRGEYWVHTDHASVETAAAGYRRERARRSAARERD